ncbi:MAG: DUF805 domain-containing protein [Paracoccaceae bacterium]
MLTFTDAVRRCFSQYVTFSGRARRSEYWWFTAFTLAGSLVAAAIDMALSSGSGFSPVTMLFQLGVFCPALAVGWRRAHDTGRPGWIVLLPLMIAVGGSALISILGLDAGGLPGEDGTEGPGPANAAAVGIVTVVQLIVAVALIWLFTRPSDPGPNAYGPPPS